MKENQDTSFLKEVKKKLIDLDMTFSAVDEVQKILVEI